MKSEKEIKKQVTQWKKGEKMLKNYISHYVPDKDGYINFADEKEEHRFEFNLAALKYTQGMLSALTWVLRDGKNE